jgi:hypothetical protein
MSATVNEMGRPKKQEPTEPIRLPESVVKLLRSIAAQFGEDPGDYAKRRFVPLMEDDAKKKAEETLRKYQGSETNETRDNKAKKPKK